MAEPEPIVPGDYLEIGTDRIARVVGVGPWRLMPGEFAHFHYTDDGDPDGYTDSWMVLVEHFRRQFVRLPDPAPEPVRPGLYRRPHGEVERVLAVVDWPEARGRLVVYTSQWVHEWCARHAGTQELDVNAFLLRESELRQLGWERVPDPPGDANG